LRFCPAKYGGKCVVSTEKKTALLKPDLGEKGNIIKKRQSIELEKTSCNGRVRY